MNLDNHTMNLANPGDYPNYFLADLPEANAINTTILREACQTLRRNREKYLIERSTESLVQLVADWTKDWLDPHYPFRREAFVQLEQQPSSWSPQVLEAGLDTFFRRFNEESIKEWLSVELGHWQCLDKPMPLPSCPSRKGKALGPELVTHITAGNVLPPAMTSIIAGLLLRSAQFIKSATSITWFLRIFLHSLYAREPKLASCLELAQWPGGKTAWEEILFEESSVVTATGSDQTLENIRCRIPAKTRFLDHGSRLSWAFIAKDYLTSRQIQPLLEQLVLDVAQWNQRGCLSPQCLFVEAGGELSIETLGELLSATFRKTETLLPRGPVSPSVASHIQNRRRLYALRAAHNKDTQVWCSEGDTSWTVVHESDPRFSPSCLDRFLYLKEVPNIGEALRACEEYRGKVTCVGLAAPAARSNSLAQELSRWGVTRICPLGTMQSPPLTWKQDGRPSLADLVTFIDYEI